MKALLAKQFDPEDRSPEAKGQRFLKRLLEYGAQAAGAKRSRSATSQPSEMLVHVPSQP